MRPYQCLRLEWSGDVCLAQVQGSSLEDSWVDELGEELLHLVEQERCRKLVLSMNQLDCLYSVLLGKLLTVSRAMQKAGGRLKLCDVPELVREVFQVCGVDSYFEFAPDRQAAMAEW